jgi:hypothetical protein
MSEPRDVRGQEEENAHVQHMRIRESALPLTALGLRCVVRMADIIARSKDKPLQRQHVKHGDKRVTLQEGKKCSVRNITHTAQVIAPKEQTFQKEKNRK